MKKTIIILFVQLLFVSAYGQNEAPSKQATMDWIGKTLLMYKNLAVEGGRLGNSYSEVKYSNFSYANNVISLVSEYYDRCTRWHVHTREYISINLNNVRNWEHTQEGYKLIGTNVYKSIEIDMSDKKSETNLYNDVTTTLWFVFVNENNIKERFEKALTNLAKYNTQIDGREAY